MIGIVTLALAIIAATYIIEMIMRRPPKRVVRRERPADHRTRIGG